MRGRTTLAVLFGALLLAATLPPPLAAQGWLTQTYAATARLEADAETLAHPGRSWVGLILPADVADAEVCVDTSASRVRAGGRTQVRVLIGRAGANGEEVTIRDLEFSWRESDPPLDHSRCLEAGSLLTGDHVEFRFRFFDMSPLEIQRRGKRISTLPVLKVTGWVRHDPFTG